MIGKTLAFPGKELILGLDLRGMNISDISWDAVRMVSIDNCTLRITTDLGVHTFAFTTADELSEALLMLSLKGTEKVEFTDDQRFNPARFLPAYDRPRSAGMTAFRRR